MPRTPGSTSLTPDDRLRLLVFLATRTNGSGALAYGAVKAACEEFGLHRNTVRAAWKARDGKVEGSDVKRGRPRKFTDEELRDRIAAIPLHKRTTVRAMAAAADKPATTLQRHVGKGKALRRVTVAAKPALKTRHKLARLLFATSHVQRPIDNSRQDGRDKVRIAST
ncbi:hypothetical protein PybrP1_001275 [[Pythium] brassicae (nom. inval.)]|nr:hypothetical protein PybrP1_001275 [[Pythium] brassicae (nom. inval.)]